MAEQEGKQPVMKTGKTKDAIEFLKKVADADRVSAELQKGDIFVTVRIARSQGFDVGVQDLWDAIVELQKNKATLAANVPTWIIDRLRVALHD